MGGGIIGKSLTDTLGWGNEILWGDKDPLNITAERQQELAAEAQAKTNAANFKLDNPEKDPQKTTSVVQI